MPSVPTEHAPYITTTLIFIVVCVGGFFGGTIDLLHKIAYKDGYFYLYDQRYSRSTFALLILRSGLVGIGGAVALCAVRIYAEEFQKHLEDLPLNSVYNFSLSMIAGFAARTLLPNIANALEKRLQDQDIKIAQQNDAVTQQNAELERTRVELEDQRQELEKRRIQNEEDDVLSAGVFALNTSAVKSEVDIAKTKLQDLLKRRPSTRKAAIYLGRLFHEKEKDFDAAIDVMSTFILKNENSEAAKDDVADMYYNKGCYLTMKAAHLQEKGAASQEIEDLRKDAILAFDRSFTLKPKNADDAADDPDLPSIRETEQFQRLLAKYA